MGGSSSSGGGAGGGITVGGGGGGSPGTQTQFRPVLQQQSIEMLVGVNRTTDTLGLSILN